MIPPCPLGAAIRRRLRERRWSQQTLAAAAGVSSKHMTYVISGTSGISADFAVRLEELIGLDAETSMALDAARLVADVRAQRSAVGS